MQTLFANAHTVDATRPEPRRGNVLVEDGLIRDVADLIVVDGSPLEDISILATRSARSAS